MNGAVRFRAVCDMGCVRTNNEDMIYAAGRLLRDTSADGCIAADGSAPVAFAVADGMGGYEGGEVASEIVCRSFAAFMNGFAPADAEAAVSALKGWAKEANRTVLSTASIRPELSEMGTTFIALVLTGAGAYLLNIGDSRCYRLRSGVLKQISTDHSERQRTGDSSVPSNLIYNFMGNRPEDFISDASVLTVIPGDRYLLCSDGLSDLVDDERIESLAHDPDALVEAAKAEGGRDNISVISIEL